MLKNLTIVIITAIIAIFLGLKLPYLINYWHGSFTKGDFSKHVSQKEYNLTLYGSTTCPHCASAREFLRKSGIHFNDLVIDQSKDAASDFKTLNENGVPVLVSSNLLVRGFDQKAYADLDKIVNKRQ